jgi:hypothetical protein
VRRKALKAQTARPLWFYMRIKLLVLSLAASFGCGGVINVPTKPPTSDACNHVTCGGNGTQVTGLSRAGEARVHSVTLPSGEVIRLK